MSQTLQLEYQCTKEERSEAKSLGLRKQLGGGSRAITLIILLTVAVVLLVIMCFVIQFQTPRPYRPYVYIGLLVLGIFFFLKNRKERKRSEDKRREDKTRIELSETEFTILGSEARASFPWASLSDCIESPNIFVLADRTKSLLFIVPKRAFPNESSQAWFRNLATKRSKPSGQTLPPFPAPPDSTGTVTLRFQLGLRDYLDRSMVSYRTWGGTLGFLVLVNGVFIYAMLTTHAKSPPVFSRAQIYFIFLLPIMLLGAVIMFLVLTIQEWLSHKKMLTPQEMGLSEESLRFASADGVGVLPWSTYKYHKETRRSFIIWNPKGLVWALIPKRAFASADDVNRCRSLIANHLQKGRWFY